MILIMATNLKELEKEHRAKADKNYQETLEAQLPTIREKLVAEGFTKINDNSFQYEADDESFIVNVELESKKNKSVLSWDYLDDSGEEEAWASDIECSDDLEMILPTEEILDKAIDKVKELIVNQIV